MTLFSKKRTTETEPVVAPKPQAANPFPELDGPELVKRSNLSQEYLTVAASIGILDTPAILNERLAACMADHGMSRYSNRAVVRYMNAVVERESKKHGEKYEWGWHPLRPVDADSRLATEGYALEVDSTTVPFNRKVYSKSIPLPVLLTVQKLAQFPVSFWVSDYAAVDPDPFLMVTEVGIQCYIIERWDEPSFRDK